MLSNTNKYNSISLGIIFGAGVFVVLVIDEWLMSINNAEPFSLMPILFGLFLYCLLEIFVITSFKSVAWQIRIAFLAGLIGFMFLNIGVLYLNEDPFLFSDDRKYNNIGKAIFLKNDVFIPLTYSGGYYFKFIGFLYRIVGPYTFNGRLVNFFCLFIIALTGYKIIDINNNNGRGKFFVHLLLFYCPAFVFFSLFEFKDMIFITILFVMIYLFKLSHFQKKLQNKAVFFGAAVCLCYVSWWFRVGVGIVFLVFNIIPFIIQRIKIKKVNLALALLGVYLISFIMANYPVFVNILPENKSRLSIKMNAYSKKRVEKQQKSGLQQFLIMKGNRDIIIAPVSVALIPFAVMNIFDAKDILQFLFAFLGFFTLIIYLGLLYNIVKGFNISKEDYYSVLLPTMVCLIILTWFNAGISRHFIFLIPLLILSICLTNINVRKMMYSGFILTLGFYVLYYSLQLIESIKF